MTNMDRLKEYLDRYSDSGVERSHIAEHLGMIGKMSDDPPFPSRHEIRLFFAELPPELQQERLFLLESCPWSCPW